MAEYLALPEGQGPGLVLLHEWWGVNDHIRSVCDRFAKAGFVVLAPDLYNGMVAAGPEDAKSLLQGLKELEVETQIRAAVATLQDHPSVEHAKVGVLGFCMGGRLALWAGCKVPSVGAVVDFYGGNNPPFAFDVAALPAPFLGLFGAKDPSIPLANVKALQDLMKAAKKHCDVVVYPEAGHAFFNDTRPDMYNAEAAADAFDRTTAFLKRFLHTHG